MSEFKSVDEGQVQWIGDTFPKLYHSSKKFFKIFDYLLINESYDNFMRAGNMDDNTC